MTEAMPRITIEPCQGQARATHEGETLAESGAALVLRERGYPPRVYFPQADVRMELLTQTTHTTHCPFKGDASYWTLAAKGETLENVAWAYPEPISAVPQIAGHISFADPVKVEAQT